MNVDGAGASVMELVGLPLQLLHYLELLHLVEEELKLGGGDIMDPELGSWWAG